MSETNCFQSAGPYSFPLSLSVAAAVAAQWLIRADSLEAIESYEAPRLVISTVTLVTTDCPARPLRPTNTMDSAGPISGAVDQLASGSERTSRMSELAAVVAASLPLPQQSMFD